MYASAVERPSLRCHHDLCNRQVRHMCLYELLKCRHSRVYPHVRFRSRTAQLTLSSRSLQQAGQTHVPL